MIKIEFENIKKSGELEILQKKKKKLALIKFW